MPSIRPSQLLAALLLGTATLGASAHVGVDGAAHHGLLAGITHPFTGLDHLVAALAVGIVASATAPQGRGARWSVPVAFALALAGGVLLAVSGVTLPAIEPMVATSVLAFGLLIATMRTISTARVAAIGAGFAVFHGAAHATELTGPAALLGMLLGTGALLVLGERLGAALRRHAPRGLRATGIATMATGLMLIATLARG